MIDERATAEKKVYQGKLNMTANNRQSNKYKYITMFETETAVIKILIFVTRAANLGVFFFQGLRLNGGDPMLELRTFFRPLSIGRLHLTICHMRATIPPLFFSRLRSSFPVSKLRILPPVLPVEEVTTISPRPK